MKLTKNMVSFKGISEGVFIKIQGEDFELIKNELNKKITDTTDFFKGTKFLGIQSEGLTQEQINEIRLILKYKYDLDISLEELPDHVNHTLQDDKPKDNGSIIANGIEEGMTRFIYGTLRSGQSIVYEGNIVVVGDVNPGAVLKAKGHIIVLGTLRGVAQAGTDGNGERIVAAYNLIPTQLRIGDTIVRPPDGDSSQSKLPELAKLINGEVVIEPYLPNK